MSLEPIRLSPLGRASTSPSPVNRMMASFAEDFREGFDINLGVGYVSESTIPHTAIEHALREVIRYPEKHKTPFNYGNPTGSTNLIAALKRFYADNAVGHWTADALDLQRIVVGVSGATSLLEAIATALPPGIVVTSDPIYYIYCDLLKRAGFELLTVPEDDDGIDTDILEEKLAALGERRNDISFVYLVTVNNPTCSILSNPRRRQLLRIVGNLSRELGRKVPLIFDTAYEMLCHDPDVTPPRSPLLQDELGIAYELGTLSKVLAPALRIGYLIGPDDPMLDAIVQNISDTGFSAPLITQEIASRLLSDHAAEQVQRVNAGYRDKAVKVRAWIDQYLGDHLATVRGGSAGFYFYLTFNAIETAEGSALFRALADGDADEPRVIYIPGTFCVDPAGDQTDIARRQMRISYGFESLPQIEKAIKRMAEVVQRVEAAV